MFLGLGDMLPEAAKKHSHISQVERGKLLKYKLYLKIKFKKNPKY
jgi:hypothetical protein